MTIRKGFYLREVPEFPRDFPERLERLKGLSGLSWRQIASRLGTDAGVIRDWRAGKRQPSTLHLFSLFRLAATVRGGQDVLLYGTADDEDATSCSDESIPDREAA